MAITVARRRKDFADGMAYKLGEEKKEMTMVKQWTEIMKINGGEECAYDAINERYGLDRNVISYREDQDEPALHDIVNMTEDLLVLRHDRGLRGYHQLPVIMTGAVTGVEVKFMSYSRRDDRRIIIETENPFQDAEAELRLTEEIQNNESEMRTRRAGKREEISTTMDARSGSGSSDRHNNEAGKGRISCSADEDVQGREYHDDGQCSHRPTDANAECTCNDSVAERRGLGVERNGVTRGADRNMAVICSDNGTKRSANDDGLRVGTEGVGIEGVISKELDCTDAILKRTLGNEADEKSMENNESPLRKRLKYGAGAGVHQCDKCKRRFRQQKAYEVHMEGCSDDKNGGDTVQRAMEMAYDLVYKDNAVDVYKRNDINPKLALVTFDENVDCRKLQIGWAKTSKWGEALGANTVEEFRKQITEWFDIGSKEPAKKLTPSRMLRLLHGLQPTRYDLSTEQQIQQVVNGLTDEEKKKRMADAAKRLGRKSEDEERNSALNVEVPAPQEDTDAVVDDDAEVLCAEESGRNVDGGEILREQPASSNGTSESNVEKSNQRSENLCGDEGDRGGSVLDTATVKKRRVVYRMPELYAEFLKAHVLGDPDCKRMEARTAMIDAMGFSGAPLPQGFPTESQVRRRITGLKYHYKKKGANEAHVQNRQQ